MANATFSIFCKNSVSCAGVLLPLSATFCLKMVPSVADRRKKAARGNEDSLNPCVKCLLRMADGFGGKDFIPCRFVPEGEDLHLSGPFWRNLTV
jgi:hypothetical protein